MKADQRLILAQAGLILLNLSETITGKVVYTEKKDGKTVRTENYDAGALAKIAHALYAIERGEVKE